MALSGGGGSGAGFGFVGATFGQTDLVSPYLQMQEQQAQEMPTFAAPETIDHQLENSVHQGDVNGFVTDAHVPLVSNQSYLYWKTQDSFNSAEDALAFHQYNTKVKETEVGINRAAESRKKSQETNQKFASLVFDPNSDYFLYENQKTLSDYNLGLQFIDNVNQLAGQGAYKREVVGGTPYYVVSNDYVEKVDNGEIEDNDLMALLETEGIAAKPTEDGLYIDATSYPFSISEGNMMSAKDWADDLAKVKPSFGEEKTTTSDGLSYLSSDGKRYLLTDQYRAAIGQRVFLKGEESFDRDTGMVKHDNVQLTPSARRYALDNEILPDTQGRYSKDDAQKVFDGMFQYQLDQQGFKRDKTDKKITREGAKSFADDFKPQGMDVAGVPLMSVSGAVSAGEKGEYITYNKGDGKYESPTSDVNVASAISIKPKNALVSIEGFEQAKVAPSRLMVDDNGEVYVKSIMKRETYDMFDDTQYADFLSKLENEGILNQSSSSETRWVRLTEDNASNLASNLGLSPEIGKTAKELLADFIPTQDPLLQKRQQARGGAATQQSTPAAQQSIVIEDDEFDFSND